jgi:hypothetical protein
MARLTTVLVALTCSLSPALGNVAQRHVLPAYGKQALRQAIQEACALEAASDELVITEATEVRVDGRACKYEDVPKGAEIVLLQVASNKKAILKIHFRTKK